MLGFLNRGPGDQAIPHQTKVTSLILDKIIIGDIFTQKVYMRIIQTLIRVIVEVVGQVDAIKGEITKTGEEDKL